MFTYGYIREAVLAHLDIDEEEAQAMSLLSRFHIFANEAMQAICSSKPKYQYVDVTVVDKFDPIVVVTDDTTGSFYFRKATEDEIAAYEESGTGGADYRFLTEEELKEYYHEQGIYEVYETVSMSDTFIAFANKQAYKIITQKPTVEQQLEAEAFGTTIKEETYLDKVKKDCEFSFVSQNNIKFYKSGHYLIPAKYLWYRFDSGLGDTAELDIPADILLCIPLYIAAKCLQIDNLQKSQILRSEFEMALARCTSNDMMKLNDIPSTF